MTTFFEMQKPILLIFILINFLKLNAQSENKTIFGFKGGLNRSILIGNELDGTKTGYVGLELYGAFFLIPN